MVKVIEPGRRTGSVVIPSSKSIAHRALIAAALSNVEPPVIRGESKDTLATRTCLRAMMSGESVWPCGESGTTLRLLEPIAGVMGWTGDFKCEGRLSRRPRMPFERKTHYVVPGNVSSQFVSGLLMSLPLADWDSEIVVDGPLQSEAYVRLTEDILVASGIRFEKSGQTWFLKGNQRYRFPGGGEVEGDWSQAAFFLAMGVEVKGLRDDSHQGDRTVVGMLEQLRRGTSDVLDVSQTPDLYPVLAAYAAATSRNVSFTGTERLRLKESDRLASTAALIDAVRAGRPVDACGDHRIAMAAAVMACYADRPVTIEGAECVAKSYPGFWDDFGQLVKTADSRNPAKVRLNGDARDKAAIRQKMRVLRRDLSPAERTRASADVCDKILLRDEVRGALSADDGWGAVAVYLASTDEIDLTQAIVSLLAKGAKLAAPRWNGRTYELARLKSLKTGDLRKGPMGILEPKEPEAVKPEEVQVWLVPGLAFTRDGGRLGYGGGWYDRLMADVRDRSFKLGVAYAFQVVEDLPAESHDIRLDDVICPRNVL